MWYYVLALILLYAAPLVFLWRNMGKIKQITEKMVDKLSESPKDVSDIFTRSFVFLIVYYVIVGAAILGLAGRPIEGIMSYLLFVIVGWALGLFTPSPFQK